MPSLECEICWKSYNESNRVPRTLACEHTLCTSCIIQLLRQGPVKCPFCRFTYLEYVISPVDLPVHQMLLSQVSKSSNIPDCGNSDESMQTEETTIDVNELRAKIQRATEEGIQVFARQETGDGKVRHARLSVCDDRLLLHTLKDDPPPNGFCIISYDKIRTLIDEVYKVIFMEISYRGISQGKVYIRLLDDAGRTRQFLYLCTGEKGPSYADTRFFEVAYKGVPGEKVWGGDYENNDGSGGSALPDMVRGPENRVACTKGLVAGYYKSGYNQDHQPSQFCIYVKYKLGYAEISSIGKVLSGLDIMVSVAETVDLHNACVSDCGLVLFH